MKYSVTAEANFNMSYIFLNTKRMNWQLCVAESVLHCEDGASDKKKQIKSLRHQGGLSLSLSLFLLGKYKAQRELWWTSPVTDSTSPLSTHMIYETSCSSYTLCPCVVFKIHFSCHSNEACNTAPIVIISNIHI